MQPDGIPDEQRELFDVAVFGKQVESFIDSDLGRHLIGNAQREIDEAMDQLKSVWPWRKRRIQELQNIIWRAEFFINNLGQAVADGLQATNLLEDEHG